MTWSSMTPTQNELFRTVCRDCSAAAGRRTAMCSTNSVIYYNRTEFLGGGRIFDSAHARRAFKDTLKNYHAMFMLATSCGGAHPSF